MESSEFSPAESDAKVLSSPSPNEFTSTSQAANNDSISDVKGVIKMEPSEFSTSDIGNFSSPTVADLPSVSQSNLKMFNNNQISGIGAGKGTGNSSTMNSILVPTIRYSRIYSLPLSDSPKRAKTMLDDSKLPIKFVSNQYKNRQKI
uniref:Uncharacterized protein n=1 Tax=Panagrolaimus davidi TaxID=227884 RepID=A0A914QGM1_9BILA